MTEWIDRLAEGMEVAPVSQAETDRLLHAARDVAHRVERRITPVSTFLLGMGVSERLARGSSRAAAFEDALEVLSRSLPDPPDAGPSESG